MRFRHPPASPSAQKERSMSFGSPVEASPSTPTTSSGKKPARPKSSEFREFRPLYLVSRNAKIEDVEEQLPSLPSSKPSSRASSVHGSEEWHSAAESMTDSPPQERKLFINTDDANNMFKTEEDILGSEQTTPRASEWPVTQGLGERPVHGSEPRPQPQYYTWEDFQQDERLHNEEDVGQAAKLDDAIDFSRPPLSQAPTSETIETLPSGGERQVSPSRMSMKDKKKIKGLAAAAMLGGGAALAAKEFADRGKEQDEPQPTEEQPSLAEQAPEKPADDDRPFNDVNALMEGTASDNEADSHFTAEDIWGEGELPDRPSTIKPPPEELEERPSLSRKSSKKTGKKGKKGKGSEPATPAESSDSTLATPAARAREPEVDFDDWFGPPTAGQKYDTAPQTPLAAEVEAKPLTPVEVPKELYARTPAKGSKKKAKKGRKSVGSLSEPQSPAPGVEDPLAAEGEKLEAGGVSEPALIANEAAPVSQAAPETFPSEAKGPLDEPTATAAGDTAIEPLAGASAAPSDEPATNPDTAIEQRSEESTEASAAAPAEPSTDGFAPTLSRKQSENSKKKQKAQAAFEEPATEGPAEEGTLEEEVATRDLASDQLPSTEASALPSPEAATGLDEPVPQAAFVTDAGTPANPTEDDWTSFGSTKKGKKGKKNKKQQADARADSESEHPMESKTNKTTLPVANDIAVQEQAPEIEPEMINAVDDATEEPSAVAKEAPAAVVEAEEKGGLRSWLPSWSWGSKKPAPEEVAQQPTVMTTEETTTALPPTDLLGEKASEPTIEGTDVKPALEKDAFASSATFDEGALHEAKSADAVPDVSRDVHNIEPETSKVDTFEPAKADPPIQQAVESLETPQTAIREAFDPWAATAAEQAPQPEPADLQLPIVTPTEQVIEEAAAAEPQRVNIEAGNTQLAAPQDNAEDFWAAPSKKKGKKGKKSAPATPPAVEDLTDQPLLEKPEETPNLENRAVDQEAVVEDRQVPDGTQANAEGESFWTPEPSKKKDRKAKKAAAAAAIAAAAVLPELSESATADSSAAPFPTDAETTLSEANEITPSTQELTATNEQDDVVDESFWRPQPSKKKGKKGKKLATSNDPGPTDALQEATTEHPREENTETDKPDDAESFWTPKSSKNVEQPATLWDDLVAEETPLPAEPSVEVQYELDNATERTLETAPEPAVDTAEPAIAAEDEWAALPAKKKKKDKKSKKATTATLEDPGQDQPPSLTPEPSASNDFETATPEASVPVALEAANDLPAPAADTENTGAKDFWDAPSKGKKSKKDKKKGLSLSEDVSTSTERGFEPGLVGPIPDSQDNTAVEAVKAVEEPTPALDTPEAAVPPSVDAAPEDEWALPAKSKKGKKGKKNRQSAFEDVPTPSEPDMEPAAATDPSSDPRDLQLDDVKEPAAALDAPEAVTPAPIDLAPEDEWALPAKGKKGKKSKKNQQSAFGDVLTPSEPEPEQPSQASKDSEVIPSPAATPAPEDTTAAVTAFADDTGAHAEPEPEDEWALPTKGKKGKNGKKSKQLAEINEPSPIPQDFDADKPSVDVPVEEHARTVEPTTSDATPVVKTIDNQAGPSKEIADAGEDDWADFGTAKKSKKAKKARKGALDAQFDQLEAPEAQQPSAEPMFDSKSEPESQDLAISSIIREPAALSETSADALASDYASMVDEHSREVGNVVPEVVQVDALESDPISQSIIDAPPAPATQVPMQDLPAEPPREMADLPSADTSVHRSTQAADNFYLVNEESTVSDIHPQAPISAGQDLSLIHI